MPDLTGGTLKNRYHVISQQSRGGMAEVYQVWDQQRSVYLAMKLLREDLSEDRVFLRRLKCEAQTLARLQHPHIVRFYGLEQDGLIAFNFFVEFIEGTSMLMEIFEANGSLTPARVLEVLRPVCAALHFAHMQGFVHCDIKPGNILIDKSGLVFVTDFGIARMADAATTTLVGLGTPAYMSPEQMLGQDPTPQTDIYSLGEVMFEMLTGGERSFTGEKAHTSGRISEKVRWEYLNLLPPSSQKFNPGTSCDLEAVVLKSLQKEPRERYQNVIELLTALKMAVTSLTKETFPQSGVAPSPSSKPRGGAEMQPPSKPLPAISSSSATPDQQKFFKTPAPARGRKIPLWLRLGGWAIILITLVGVFLADGPTSGGSTVTPTTTSPGVLALTLTRGEMLAPSLTLPPGLALVATNSPNITIIKNVSHAYRHTQTLCNEHAQAETYPN